MGPRGHGSTIGPSWQYGLLGTGPGLLAAGRRSIAQPGELAYFGFGPMAAWPELVGWLGRWAIVFRPKGRWDWTV